MKENVQATRNRLRYLPGEWLEECTDNLEDTEVPAPADTLLKTQIRKFQRQWQPGSRLFVLTSQKTEIEELASEQRFRGLLAGSELVNEYLVLQAEYVGDQITADNKVLSEGG